MKAHTNQNLTPSQERYTEHRSVLRLQYAVLLISYDGPTAPAQQMAVLDLLIANSLA